MLSAWPQGFAAGPYNP